MDLDAYWALPQAAEAKAKGKKIDAQPRVRLSNVRNISHGLTLFETNLIWGNRQGNLTDHLFLNCCVVSRRPIDDFFIKVARRPGHLNDEVFTRIVFGLGPLNDKFRI